MRLNEANSRKKSLNSNYNAIILMLITSIIVLIISIIIFNLSILGILIRDYFFIGFFLAIPPISILIVVGMLYWNGIRFWRIVTPVIYKTLELDTKLNIEKIDLLSARTRIYLNYDGFSSPMILGIFKQRDLGVPYSYSENPYITIGIIIKNKHPFFLHPTQSKPLKIQEDKTIDKYFLNQFPDYYISTPGRLLSNYSPICLAHFGLNRATPERLKFCIQNLMEIVQNIDKMESLREELGVIEICDKCGRLDRIILNSRSKEEDKKREIHCKDCGNPLLRYAIRFR